MWRITRSTSTIFCRSRFFKRLTSGTAAIHLALLALDVAAGDEVIVPATAPVMTALPVLAVGARPIFADVASPHTFALDLRDGDKITRRTRGHLSGVWGLVHHQRFGDFGADENLAQAAARELHEETGLTRRCSSLPACRCLLASLTCPWPPHFGSWRSRFPLTASRASTSTSTSLYAALADLGMTRMQSERLAFAGYALDQLAGLDMFTGTRLLAVDLFSRIDALTSHALPGLGACA